MFWDFPKKYYDNIAVIDADKKRTITYRVLKNDVELLLKHISGNSKKLVFLFCENIYESLLAYIAVLQSGNAVALINYPLSLELKQPLITKYTPELILATKYEEIKDYEVLEIICGIYIYRREEALQKPKIYNELALLLSTSGTTGSPKFVRLSYKNIQSNAESIAKYLSIKKRDRAISSLPIQYSYGLSIINSHLLKGASIVLTKQNFVLHSFWEIFNKYNCTSFSGVPYSYELLKYINFHKFELPSLKTLTQAGGSLREELQKYFYRIAKNKKVKFYIMYGQTEASPRISFVPPKSLHQKFGSIGKPIPSGKIKLFWNGSEVTKPGSVGELVYFGANVMLGYAYNRNDLSKGDELNGILHTGDLAKKDKDGYYYIIGREKRFIKVYGLRINLDEIEKMLALYTGCAVACFGEDENINIVIKSSDEKIVDNVRKKIFETYHLNLSVMNIRTADNIPATLNGKYDYRMMDEVFFNKEI